MNNTENIENIIVDSFKVLRDEVSDLYLPKEITKLNELPDSFDFYKNWVAPNIPVVIKGAINHWPAIKNWNKEYICNKLRDKLISVTVTPNGYADAITETVIDGKTVELFVLPEEKLMTVSNFFSKLDDCTDSTKGIFYIQKQNSNLTEEFPELLPDIDENLLWASTIFESKPTAINLWIGDKRAITSLHKDPFENIYCVVSGYKEFILLPPTDRPWVPYKTLPVGQYKETPEGFEIKMQSDLKIQKDQEVEEGENTVPWIPVDPLKPNYEKFPLYKNASPLKVRVEAGDMFYLPSLWFHHVSQSHECIAVNYWYDMSLDIKYAYFQFIENLTTKYCKS